MSKAVTQSFVNAWTKKFGKTGQAYVQYQKRYWNGSAYVYTGTWVSLATRDFKLTGQLTMKLDTPLLNTVKASNVSLRLRNDDWQWLPTNVTTGVLRADATATAGYEPFLMKIRIQFGYKLASGAYELVTLMTGVAIDYVFDTASAEVEVLVSGNEYLLEAADAQQVSTAFTSEACTPVADGANKVFTTASLGVAFITSVDDNGSAQVQGLQYTLSNIGQYNTAATVTFASAPTAGHTIHATGRKWYTLQKVEDLVGLLCDQAGIGAGSRTIQPAVIPGVSANFKVNTTAQWQACTVSGTDPFILANNIVIGTPLANGGFETGALTNWTSVLAGNGSANVQTTGAGQPTPQAGTYMAHLQVNDSGGAAPITTYTATVCLVDSGGAEVGSVTLMSGVPGDHGSLPSLAWQSGSIAIPAGSGPAAYKLRFKLVDGVGNSSSITTGTFVQDGAYGTPITFYWNMSNTIDILNSNGNPRLYIDSVVAHAIPASGTFQTAEIDLGSTPTGWAAILPSVTLNGGTISFRTKTSTTSGGTYSAFTATDASYVPQSPLRRYLIVEGTFNANAAQTTGPVMSQMIVQFITSIVQIALCNFSGQTCFDALQRLAQLCDYEWGFDGSGNLFFRSKTASTTPVVTIDQSAKIARIVDFRPGYDTVYNSGQVTYGQYYSEYNSSSLPETSPTSQQRFMTRVRSEDYSDFLLAYDANLAGGRSRVIHDNNYLPKRRCRVQGAIIPQLDLSDTISVSYFDRPIMKDNVFGDPLRPYAPAFGLETNLLLRSVLFKVVGITVDPVACTGEYDLQEVL